jgi:hypothetical protein
MSFSDKMLDKVDKDSGVLSKIWNDVFGPSGRKIGRALGAVTGIILYEFRKWEFYDDITEAIYVNNLKQFKERLDQIPEENVITAPPEIAAQILGRFQYTSNEDLSKAFQTLLVNACNSDTVHLVHPAFIHMIDRLAPDEAKILSFLSNWKLAYLTFDLEGFDLKSLIYLSRNQEWFTQFNLDSPSDILFQKYSPQVVTDPSDNFISLITALGHQQLNYPQNFSIYIDNLISLGLIQDQLLGSVDTRAVMHLFPKDLGKLKSYQYDKHLKFYRGVFLLTNFGRLFSKACNMLTVPTTTTEIG